MFKIARSLVAWLPIVAILATALAASAQQPTPATGIDIYTDPSGRFSVPIPTNWSIETRDQIAILRDPDGLLEVQLLVLQEDSIDDAVPVALESIDPPFFLSTTPDASGTLPPATGVDETQIITYISPDQSQFVQILGQRVGRDVYCMVFSGSFDAASKRSSQIQIIAGGFKILSLDEVDFKNAIPADLSPELLAEFESYVLELLTRLEVPGASVAIVADGKIVYAQGFGVKQSGSSDLVTADTQMMIGSTTKSMTTMMMATEVDDQLLSWDEPVIEILPEFAVADPALTESITVRNLVCACTGVPRRDLEFVFNAKNLTAEDVIASLQDFQFYTGFGEAFQYSNQMVATGGYIAAAAAGGVYGGLFDSYVATMQARVFDPIGMPDTTFSFDSVKANGDYAMPHGATLAGDYVPISLNVEEALIPVAPAGLVWSTANDMARYLITEMNGGIGPDGNKVVSVENLRETWVPQVAVDAETSYGLGWFLEERNGVRLTHHGGNTFGFSSELAFLPDKHIGIVVLANGQVANLFTEGVRKRLLELLFHQPALNDKQIDFLLGEANIARDAVEAQIEDVPAEIAEEAIGRYTNQALGSITLSMERDELMLDAGEFRTELKALIGSTADGEIAFVSADPPIAGAIFALDTGPTGERDLVLSLGAETYTFVQR